MDADAEPAPHHRRFNWLADAVTDARYAGRALCRQPAFAAVAIVTMALGIGANTATFSVIHGVLLQPLPYPNWGALVRVWETVPGSEIGQGKGPDRRHRSMDVLDFLAVSSRARTISQLASYGLVRPTTTVGGETSRLEGYSVSVGFFPMLRVAPLVGRTFSPEEGIHGHERVIVLGYDTWQRLGGTSAVLGRTVTFTGDPDNAFGGAIGLNVGYTVIGVMPRGFGFPDGAGFWIPRVIEEPPAGRSRRIQTVARIAPGATVDAAAAEFEAIQRDRLGASRGRGTQSTRRRFQLIRLHDEVTRPVKPALLVLAGAVALVLLIACVNVANLLLARAESRKREISVRAAIGASRGRLMRQMLVESVLLSTCGGAGGVALAFAAVRLFRVLGTTLGRIDLDVTSVVPRLNDVSVDATVLGYAVVISIATGVLFGLVPALRHSQTTYQDALRDSTSSPRTGLKNVLVVGEIGLATVLLVAGGLLANSFTRLATVDVGFDPSHLITFQVAAPGVQPAEYQRAFAERFVERLRALPRSEAAAYARQLPLVALEDAIALTTRRNGIDVLLGDAPDIRFVSRDYLPAIGARIIAGRNFGVADGEGRPGVVIVNEAFVRREFAGVSPVGQVVYFGPRREMPLEIIGVVSDIRQFGLDLAPEPQYFMDMRQVRTDPEFRAPPLFPIGAYYVVRTRGNRAAVVNDIRTVLRQLDPMAALENVATMEQIISNSVARPWMYTVLLGVFAAVGLLLAAIGLYGVMAYVVAQRTREIGIRMALGADRRRVLGLVLRQSGGLTAVGLGFGVCGAAVANRSLATLLFGVTPLDPATYAAAAAVFAAVAMAASYMPARQATAIDPLTALKTE